MKVGLIGAGRMAEAIIAALLDADVCDAAEVIASDVSEARRAELNTQYGIGVTADNAAVVAQSEMVILAVKPQDLDAVLESLDGSCSGKLLVSIAAGKTLAYFESRLPDARFVRVMPNLACQVGEGMSAICGGNGVRGDDLAAVRRVLSCMGKVVEIAESQFDTVTSLSGSGPAFFAFVLNAMVDGAVQDGLEEGAALMLAEQTMLGAAKVLQVSGDSPESFMSKVASKGGTTLAGLAVLKESAVHAGFVRTIKAAADRSREMGE